MDSNAFKSFKLITLNIEISLIIIIIIVPFGIWKIIELIGLLLK